MASNIAIIAAADRYTFFQDGKREGQALSGRLGGLVVWDDGTVEAVPAALEDPRRPVLQGGFGLARAKRHALAALQGQTWAAIGAA